MTLRIGLTGGIACGKSLVSHDLAQKGIPVIDADLVAREVAEPGSVGLQQITETFGDEMLQGDGTLNRRRLGDLVFSRPEALETLNRIMHPLIYRAIEAKLQQLQDRPIVVLDIPLLFEQPEYQRLVDRIWVVTCTEDLQQQRLCKRNGFTEEEARRRIQAQLPLAEKCAKADVIIDNSGSKEETLRQVTVQLEKSMLY